VIQFDSKVELMLGTLEVNSSFAIILAVIDSVGICGLKKVGKEISTALPYLTLPSGWAGCYTCPALRPYQFGPMRNPDVTTRSQ